MSKDARIPAGRALVVGLGNPGSRYDGTRHNVGFAVLDELARRWGASSAEKKFKGLLATAPVGAHTVMMLAPQTYMNVSGESVGPALGFFKLGVDALIVIHDDIDLPTGRVRLKKGGGHGGHNGLRSLDQHLPSRDYLRVRLGVDRPPPGGEVASWVLGRFFSEERAAVDEMISVGADAVEALLSEGLLDAQHRIHSMKSAD